MWMVKIQVPDKNDAAKALVEMAKRGRVDCYADCVYVVPEPALDLLKKLGIDFVELERGGIDYAEKMLRDTLTSHAQRRTTPRPDEIRAEAG